MGNGPTFRAVRQIAVAQHRRAPGLDGARHVGQDTMPKAESQPDCGDLERPNGRGGVEPTVERSGTVGWATAGSESHGSPSIAVGFTPAPPSEARMPPPWKAARTPERARPQVAGAGRGRVARSARSESGVEPPHSIEDPVHRSTVVCRTFGVRRLDAALAPSGVVVDPIVGSRRRPHLGLRRPSPHSAFGIRRSTFRGPRVADSGHTHRCAPTLPTAERQSAGARNLGRARLLPSRRPPAWQSARPEPRPPKTGSRIRN